MPLRLILCLLMINGCRFQPVNVVGNGPVLIDSSLPEDKAKFYHTKAYAAGYPIYYVGPVTDTIVLPSQPLAARKAGDEEFEETTLWTCMDSAHLKIIVDTGFCLSHCARYTHFEWQERAHAAEVLDSIIYYKAIPVFLYNNGAGMLNIGTFGALDRVVMQVKNEKSDWQDIVQPPDYYCRTGASNQVLKAGEMAVAKLLLMEGNYRTHCRLKFELWKDSVFSNEFPFTIDRRQLQKE